jgi:hypothetical protein
MRFLTALLVMFAGGLFPKVDIDAAPDKILEYSVEQVSPTSLSSIQIVENLEEPASRQEKIVFTAIDDHTIEISISD